MRRPMLLAAASLLVVLSGGEPAALARPLAHRVSGRLLPAPPVIRPAADPAARVAVTAAGAVPVEAPSPGAVPVAGGGLWPFWGPRIRGCESGSGPNGAPNYRALNRRTGASGAYQFLDGTWHGRYGVRKARDASPEQQEIAAYELYLARGTQPWRSAEHCWRATPPPGVNGSGPLAPPPGSGTTAPPPAPASQPQKAQPPAPAKPSPDPAKRRQAPPPKSPPKDEPSGIGKLLPGGR